MLIGLYQFGLNFKFGELEFVGYRYFFLGCTLTSFYTKPVPCGGCVCENLLSLSASFSWKVLDTFAFASYLGEVSCENWDFFFEIFRASASYTFRRFSDAVSGKPVCLCWRMISDGACSCTLWLIMCGFLDELFDIASPSKGIPVTSRSSLLAFESYELSIYYKNTLPLLNIVF